MNNSNRKRMNEKPTTCQFIFILLFTQINAQSQILYIGEEKDTKNQCRIFARKQDSTMHAMKQVTPEHFN